MSSSASSNFSIRACEAADIPAVLGLWLDAQATPTVTDNAADLERMLARGVVLIAESDGKLVGSVIGVFDGWRANIYRLAVHPSYRRRGIARALVCELERHLLPEGVKRIAAIVEVDHPWAIGFWEAQGYSVKNRTVRYTKNV